VTGMLPYPLLHGDHAKVHGNRGRIFLHMFVVLFICDRAVCKCNQLSPQLLSFFSEAICLEMYHKFCSFFKAKCVLVKLKSGLVDRCQNSEEWMGIKHQFYVFCVTCSFITQKESAFFRAPFFTAERGLWPSLVFFWCDCIFFLGC
jgi:hypothetical protein